jgi:multidrug efflux system membrane fusion protein
LLHLRGEIGMKRRIAWVLGVTVVAGLFVAWRFVDSAPSAHAADPAPPPPAVPVTTAAAQVQDVPVLLNGLGTVQAFNIVAIQSQVTGNLIALPAKEGQEVHKGDIVAEIDPRPYQAALDHANAQRAEDSAQLQSMQLDLQRYQNLAKREFAPVQQVDDQQATVNKTIATISADDAAIETAKINLGYCVIRAPIDGRVSLYQVDVGNLVQVGGQNSIISITQDKPIAVVFTLPEADLVRVRDALEKGSLPVEVVSNSDEQKTLANGTLMTPNNTIDTSTGTISLKAKFENQDDHLWPGQFVDARVQVQVLNKAVTVPTLSIMHGPDGLYVYKVKPDQTVDQVTVQVGYQDNGRSVVTKGLTGNETLVLTGQSRLAPGVHVHVQQAPAAAASDGSASAG